MNDPLFLAAIISAGLALLFTIGLGISLIWEWLEPPPEYPRAPRIRLDNPDSDRLWIEEYRRWIDE
jgi:hypothetical protein